MKIAFVIGVPVVFAGHGVVGQMLTWKRGLESLGHNVILVSPWEYYDWKTFDIVHFFMFSEYVADFIELVCTVNKNIVFSPILDPNFSIFSMKMLSYWGNTKFKLSNRYYRIRKIAPLISMFSTRSEFESRYVEKAWGVRRNHIFKVPLSYNYLNSENSENRENFCFHASYLADDRKNVKRLVAAAKKFGFPLKLAGKLRNKCERQKVLSWIENVPNVEYLGFLPQKQLLDTYRKAKVFALPSTNEGVGIVALDAAAMGCDIVVTNLGGPKEYYGSLATRINPYSIDDIGQAIVKNLSGFSKQPALQKYVQKNFSLRNIAERLQVMYQKVLDNV